MVTMKIYDRKAGVNFIEICPANAEKLVTILYGVNRMIVSMSRDEVREVINFLTKEFNAIEPYGNLPPRDANTKV
jgi:DNA-directed RNA polymerase subunit F